MNLLLIALLIGIAGDWFTSKRNQAAGFKEEWPLFKKLTIQQILVVKLTAFGLCVYASHQFAPDPPFLFLAVLAALVALQGYAVWYNNRAFKKLKT